MSNKIVLSDISAGNVHIKQKGDGSKRIHLRMPKNTRIHLLGNYTVKEYS